MSKIRQWAQLFLVSDEISPYQVQQFQQQPDLLQQRKVATKTKTKKTKKKTQKDKLKNVSIAMQDHKKCIHPQIISTIITHEEHSKYGIIYYITKIRIGDDIIFLIPANAVATMHKLDRRQINQYNTTN